ncbi:molybdopterin-guanine dinucleotide biosynthesis protein B [Methanofollis fontis]|uniref:Molybdopterin-guanine dinucleotide biosynthesis protein B n=1 Tax=Methanofollis fontis TaxID=2052832 RepID=A0A483CXT1_9EURY|nr:molybdopterin-guanine dinucleotide biosynthesis protein B [Methanofollis fontis]TAJ44173.1 molybdopterin-guanine dinucleotide biosynthesis protein B [Methanofollis fontis]
MKIIQVVGRSNSGKTTFIEALIPILREQGSIAVIKHLGHDRFAVNEGKDTSRYMAAGADRSVGIDDIKSVAILDTADLKTALTEICDAGVEVCIIEGFKTIPFPRIVIGDLETEGAVLRNPSTADVISSLALFEDYYTMQGVVRELRRTISTERAGCILTFNGLVREITGDQRTEYLDFAPSIDPIIESLEEEARNTPGVIGARFHHQKGRLCAGEDITYFALIAEHRQEAFAAMSRAIDRLKSEAHNKP